MRIEKQYDIQIGDKTMSALFTDLAPQANGSVVMKYGDTEVLVTATMGKEKEGIDFFPLSVEYEERFYAAGAILGSRFKRREGMPSEEAILSARVVDRTIRPLFNKKLRREVQVVITVLSIGKEDPDVLGILGASLALGVSDIPWGGPVSAIRLGKTKDKNELIIQPDYEQRSEQIQTLDLLSCGKDGNINMIEIGAKEVSENEIKEALEKSVEIHEQLQAWQEQIIKEIGKEKQEIKFPEYSEELKSLFNESVKNELLEWVFEKNSAYELKEKWMEIVKENLDESQWQNADDLFEEEVDKLVHEQAIYQNRRQDKREMDEIRELYAKAGGLTDIVHGVGFFYRGLTHVMSVTTLGGPEDAQIIDTIEEQDSSKRFMHHYNFPPFSVGETGKVGGLNRRAIGHGALVEKALKAVIPPEEEFPYTIRVVSETMSSNGSSSQASVCASTLSLMDAGVPIKNPVAGIAMGLMADESLIGKNKWEKDKYKILTDIQGPEDHFGDMDFKVAGTRVGVTAVQMDVKLDGVPVEVLAEAFEKAKKARLQILDIMEQAIKEPRKTLKETAPKIERFEIDKDQIGLVIGPGGKTINQIKDETGANSITIEQDGVVYITGKGDSASKAKQKIEELTKDYEPGDKVEAEVVKIADFGAFVKVGNKDGLIHISEIAPERVDKVEDYLKVGQKVPCIIKEIDERGRLSLSIKDIEPNYFKTNDGK